MPEMDLESEIKDLKRRVDDLEGAVSVLTGHVGRVHPDLVHLARTTTARFDKVEDLMGKVAGRLDLLNTQVWSLRDELPGMLDGKKQPGGNPEA